MIAGGRRQHADDLVRLIVAEQRAADDVGCAREPIAPQRVADDDDPVLAAEVLVRMEHASERRRDAEDVEEIR